MESIPFALWEIVLYYTMQETYSSSRFWQHVTACKAMIIASRFTTLGSYFTKHEKGQSAKKPIAKNKDKPVATSVVHPCSGITALHDPCIAIFVHRTGADGGGAWSITEILRELFNKMLEV